MGSARSRLRYHDTVARVHTGNTQPSTQNHQQGYYPANWEELTAMIQAGEHVGMEYLYRVFDRSIRYYFRRYIGWQDLDDRIHDTLLIVVKAIQNGALREPNCLMAYIRTVVRRQVAEYIGSVIHRRRDQTGIDHEHSLTVPDGNHNPEQRAMAIEETGLVKIALESLSPTDREILVRFYLNEQSQEQICREMSLTDTQFRLKKSRAKKKFGALGRKNLAPLTTADSLVRLQIL
jgi:RNA polymerase sigma-70 factor (ECF subfamily)